MRVKIHGPNLNSAAQRKATFHVHEHNCADNKRYGPGKSLGGEDRGMPYDAKSVLDLVDFIYCDIIDEQPPSVDKEEYTRDLVHDFWFAPCIRELPYDAT